MRDLGNRAEEEGRLSPPGPKMYKDKIVSVLSYRDSFQLSFVVCIYTYELRSRSLICHFPGCCEPARGGVTTVGAFHPLAIYPGIVSESVDMEQSRRRAVKDEAHRRN